MKKALIYSTAFAAVFGVATAAHAVDLTIVSWGGAYSAMQKKAYHTPYMEKNQDVKILMDDSGAEGLSKLRAQVEAGNVTWDLVDMIATDAIAACDEGLVHEIDADTWLKPAPDGTPASKDFLDGTLHPGGSNCIIPQNVYSTTFGYRTDAFDGAAPSSINDVFDLEQFPGKRALQKSPKNNLEWALLADGVPADRVYELLSDPAGVDRAFEKLDTIRDQVVWWTQGAQPPQLLADGEVAMASGYNGRLFNAIAVENQPIAMMWDYQMFDYDGWVVPKGTKDLAAVKEFIRFATDTKRLADQTKYISYGPPRKSSLNLVGKHVDLGIDMKPHMPTAPANAGNILNSDYVWWADHNDELKERFNAWLVQ